MDPSAPRCWSGRTVLVTGAAGFLGAHLVRRLAGEGATVVALARSETPLFGDGVRHVGCDLVDTDAFAAVLREVRPDVVYHLGGRVSGAPDPGLVWPTFHSLLASSIALLDAAQRGFADRVVLISTSDEMETGLPPASPYAAAKAAMAAYGRLYVERFGCSVVMVRPTEVFGPGQASSKLLPYSGTAALRGERPRLSSGRRRGDWVYVADVIEGMLGAATAPAGSELEFGQGELRSNREMVEGLLDHLATGVAPLWGALPDRQGETEHVAVLEPAQRLLGWKATVSIDDGLRMTAAALRAAAS
ncbi:NAD(P)-dependent oxidoreductase [Pseudonocardia sp. N23]|uniref:NAD-dependent epimerase/dehydratase family protein n=1 Tax=Pseudonocardia sp. N23 TaxID=1987376 RepID=UPI000BFD8A4B|nr:NAD(P)-dependent oxidoreductase [Pseudonocardia sp. N23]GAY12201.1 UDP-glucose 4-epimerase [Pseudonocardia sp. N23]